MDDYDVAILGGGLAGSLLGTLLARQGVRTIIIEGGSHPRFAIGESLIPETTLRFKLIARRYDVPELAHLGTFHGIRDHISASCGVKRSFAFAYHREGEPARAEHCHELPTLTPPVGPDAHLFRQDVDAWLLALAARYGAEVRQQTRVEDFELRSDGVELRTTTGDIIRAAYLVDGSGFRSPVAEKLGLRDEVPQFRTDTRCLFTHMVGVPAYDQIGPQGHGMPVPLAQSTLHHVFDGGWIWVIPFDNHEQSINPLCSVGLVLDRRKHPEPGPDPEAEFREIIGRFPTIAKHFEGATAFRPWISTGRLQYSSSRTVGDRYCLLPHAAAFIDPLYSSGLSMTSLFVDRLTQRLLHAVRADDWDRAPFEELEKDNRRILAHYDRIVSRSFDSWRSFELWNAWQRIWGLGNIMGTWGPLSQLMRFEGSGDKAILSEGLQPENVGCLSSQHPEVQVVVDQADAILERAVSGELDDQQASNQVLALLGSLDFFPPYLRLGDPNRRYNAFFTLIPAARILLWYRFFAPQRWRNYCYFGAVNYLRATLKWIASSRSRGRRRMWQGLRDVVRGWNNDWRRSD